MNLDHGITSDDIGACEIECIYHYDEQTIESSEIIISIVCQ